MTESKDDTKLNLNVDAKEWKPKSYQQPMISQNQQMPQAMQNPQPYYPQGNYNNQNHPFQGRGGYQSYPNYMPGYNNQYQYQNNYQPNNSQNYNSKYGGLYKQRYPNNNYNGAQDYSKNNSQFANSTGTAGNNTTTGTAGSNNAAPNPAAASSSSTTKKTPLSLTNTFGGSHLSKLSYKPFVPKNLKGKMGTQEPKEVNFYFLDDIQTGTQKYKMTLDYLLSFEGWAISKEKKLLTEKLLTHLKNMETIVKQNPKESDKRDNKKKNDRSDKGKGGKYKDKRGDDKKQENKNEFQRSENVDDLKQWGRKDLTKEIALAEQFKQSFDKEKLKDPIKFEITEKLNILTEDNYDNTKKEIYDIIKESVEIQTKFLDVLFTKAINEKPFVPLYAKLCKEMDKTLPQKKETKKQAPTTKAAGAEPGKSDAAASAPKKESSQMRAKLLDKCREIFKTENNKELDEYIKADDPQEKEIKLKKFILGNVNFIGELISVQILSKKIVFQCIDNLFKRYEKSKSDKVANLLNLEAIVILTDKFGTILNKKIDKIKPEAKKQYEEIYTYIDKLDDLQKKDDIPGYIKYKIINLVERSKNNWKESLVEKHMIAKSKKDVQKEYEESQMINANINEDRILDQSDVSDAVNKDLTRYREFMEERDEGEGPTNYDWTCVENIYNNNNNSIALFIGGFLNSCIDFVNNKKNLEIATSYFEEVMSYYKKSIKNSERHEISKRVIHLLETAHDYSLDNPAVLDTWSNVISILHHHKYINSEDFSELKKLDTEELRDVLVILAKFKTNNREYFDKFRKGCKLIDENQNLFDELYSKELEKKNK